MKSTLKSQLKKLADERKIKYQNNPPCQHSSMGTIKTDRDKKNEKAEAIIRKKLANRVMD